MDINELQNTWAQMSEELEKQKRLTNEIIIKMTQQDYTRRLDKITGPERFGTVICFIAAAFILYNFKTLDTTLLKICGIITLAVLLIMPYFSLKYLGAMRNLDIAHKSYRDTLVTFTKRKRQYQKLLKLSVYLGFALMLIILPVTTKIFNGENLFEQTDGTWLWFLPVGIAFYYFFTRKVIKYYNANIQRAGDLLKELE